MYCLQGNKGVINSYHSCFFLSVLYGHSVHVAWLYFIKYASSFDLPYLPTWPTLPYLTWKCSKWWILRKFIFRLVVQKIIDWYWFFKISILLSETAYWWMGLICVWILINLYLHTEFSHGLKYRGFFWNVLNVDYSFIKCKWLKLKRHELALFQLF